MSLNEVCKLLTLPLCDNDIKDLKIGEIFYLSGTLFTGRDEVYHRITEEKQKPPVDLKGMAVYHAGPIVKKIKENYELVSIGPTSSIRLEKWAYDFIKTTGIKIMIGKGGMGEKTASACREECAIHCVYPGGCAVLGASQIEKIDGVFWEDLGMAECIWSLKTNKFGPLIVSIDTHGNNLFMENILFYNSRK
ncbi:MAG: FumA C-terminus/TtdB family hydratase beta subunit [Treponema sp.]|nr:FumA C-terminus/TtdB family hydratase beta subunit [Treponema sp.]MCL2252401.1 FumA C-terminus/TtdB family hydratase beta subunit [Treponema sp.]